jgi:hypothetical protein
VEFAVQRRREGVSLQEAAVEGAKLRFRPIQMTSFAFIAGLLPLVVASGAGAIGNRTIGATGIGGMLVGTVVGVLVIPGLYYLFGQLDGGRKLLKDEVDEPLSEIFERQAHAAHDGQSTHARDSNGFPLPCETAESPASLLSKPVIRLPFPVQIPATTDEKATGEIPATTEEETAESPASLLSKLLSRRPFPLQIPETTDEKATGEIPEDTDEKSLIGS